jgi:hypothetical protein
LWFLAPGLVHQLGNTLFAVQGHAQVATATVDAAPALLAAVDRGSDVLLCVRALLGDAVEPVSLARLLSALGDLLRVPLREAGVRLELAVAATADIMVLPASLLQPVTGLVRHLLAASGGTAGAVAVTAGPPLLPGQVSVRCLPRPGSLPFRCDAAGLAARLDRELPGLGVGCAPLDDDSGILLSLPRTGSRP